MWFILTLLKVIPIGHGLSTDIYRFIHRLRKFCVNKKDGALVTAALKIRDCLIKTANKLGCLNK